MTNLPATPIHPTFWQGYPADPFLAHLNLTSPSNTSHAGHSGEMWQAGVSTHVAWSPPPPHSAPRLSHFESSHSTSLQIRLDVSRVQESDAHEEARPREGPQLPKAERALQVGVR